MKKVLFTVALFTVCSVVTAQETTGTTSASSEFKPEAGANNLELNLTPFGNSPISITNIRYRRFLSETTALRIGVGLSIASNSTEVVLTSNIGGEDIKKRSKSSTFGWNLKPGYEMHFEGTKRLSPYIGGELDLAGQSSKSVSYSLNNPLTDELTETTVKNAGKTGFFRVGANAVAGFDCYITKHLYLGTEMGFGFSLVSYSKVKTESSPAATPAVKDVDQGRSFNLGPNFNSAIRVGYIF